MDVKKLIVKYDGKKVKDVKLQKHDMRKIEIEVNMKGGSHSHERELLKVRS